MNVLYPGDNLQVLRDRIGSDSVDLIYLDPPFNTCRLHHLGVRTHDKRARAMPAFDDSWTWGPELERELRRMRRGPHPSVAALLDSFRKVLGEGGTTAWLVTLSVRLVELHRVLKRTGSLYLHCDPATSHYVRVILDALFGPDRFLNEVVWRRTSSHNSARRYGPAHDTLLFYAKSSSFTWTGPRGPYDEAYLAAFFTHTDKSGRRWRRTDLTGPGLRHGPSGRSWKGYDPSARSRHWQPPKYFYEKYKELTGGDDLARYELLQRLDRLEEAGLIHWPAKPGGMPQGKRWLQDAGGVPLQDVWTDIKAVHNLAEERVGYPTQKPLALLDRIIRASSKEGARVLDPYCGSGTTLVAAQSLGRLWIGIDQSAAAITAARRRLDATDGSYDVWTCDA